MGEQDFLDSTASAQTPTFSLLWQCLGPWRARISPSCWRPSWGPLPLGAKHRQGLTRSSALGNGVSQVGYKYRSVTNIPVGDAPLRLGGGGGGDCSGQGQRSRFPERQRGICFWTGTTCWAPPEAHTAYIGYQLIASVDEQRYATVRI